MALYSIRGYARYRGVSHVAVLKALDTGRIPRRKDGKVDSRVADRAWAANTDLRKPRNSVTGRTRAARDDFDAPLRRGPEEQLVVRGLAAAQALRARAEARIAQLRYEQMAGLLIPKADVRAQIFSASRRLQEQLYLLEDRLAPVLAGTTSIEDCRAAIRREVQQVLLEIRRLEASGGSKGKA